MRDVYICGPAPFMDIVEGELLTHEVDAQRIHIERFTPAEPVATPEVADEAESDHIGGDDLARRSH